MIGRVVSVKTKNTAVVLIEGTKTHPLYKKSFLRSKRFMVDDQVGVKPGDLVDIVKIRPISKMKHWKVVEVVGRDIEEIVEEQLKEEAGKLVSEVMPEKIEEEESRVESQESSEKVSNVSKASKVSKIKNTDKKEKVEEKEKK